MMKAKQVHVTTKARRRHSSAKKGPQKATTFRIDPVTQERLILLGRLTKTPLNRLVNQAVAHHVEISLARVEVDLEETLHRIQASRKRDPNFDAAIAQFAEAEAVMAGEDPVEGKAASVGPAQATVRELLRG